MLAGENPLLNAPPPLQKADFAGHPREGALKYLQRMIREQGDSARYESPYGPVFFFNHPDQVQTVLQAPNFIRTTLVSLLLGNGLLASDGPFWRSQRRLMQPRIFTNTLCAGVRLSDR